MVIKQTNGDADEFKQISYLNIESAAHQFLIRLLFISILWTLGDCNGNYCVNPSLTDESSSYSGHSLFGMSPI